MQRDKRICSKMTVYSTCVSHASSYYYTIIIIIIPNLLRMSIASICCSRHSLNTTLFALPSSVSFVLALDRTITIICITITVSCQHIRHYYCCYNFITAKSYLLLCIF
jgi:hypothetical protein